MPDIDNSTVLLQDKNGQVLELTTSHLEDIFREAASTLPIRQSNYSQADEENAPEPDDTPEMLLNNFGMQRPIDVIRFLNSTEGKITLGIINDKLAEILSRENQLRQEALEQQRADKCLIAWILLGMMYKNTASAEYVIEEERQNLERIKAVEHLNKVASFESSTRSLGELLAKTKNEMNEVAAKIANIDEQIEEAKEKYEKFDTYLDELDQEVAIMKESPDFSHEMLEDKINHLTDSTDVLANEISTLLEENKPKAAYQKMLNLEKVHMGIHHLKDQVSVMKGHHVFLKADGTPTKHPHEHHFILSAKDAAENKIIHDNGNHYFIKKHQNFNELSPKEKEAGAKKYAELRPEITGVRSLMKHNSHLEFNALHHHKREFTSEHQKLAQQLQLVSEKHTQAKAEYGKLKKELPSKLKNSTDEDRPRPSLSKSPTQTPPLQPTPNLPRNFLKRLQEVQKKPTKEDIKWLASTVPNTPSQKLLLEQLNRLKAGQPIPPVLMNLLLSKRHEGDAWLASTSPQIIKKHAMTPLDKNEPAPNKNESTPSPSSTTPRPKPQF